MKKSIDGWMIENVKSGSCRVQEVTLTIKWCMVGVFAEHEFEMENESTNVDILQ